MGAIGKCCCEIECEPCVEQAGLTTWSIYESLWGFSFSGTFGSLREEDCLKVSEECQVERNIQHDSCSSETAWTDWLNLWSCGACVDCETGTLPPPCPTDLSGNIDCPVDYPTYTTVDISAREKIVTNFWYSKAVNVAVYAIYVASQVKFRVDVIGMAAASSTFAVAILQRYRRSEFLCVYNTLESRTVFADNPFPVIAPLEPCYDLFEAGTPFFDSNFPGGFWPFSCGDFPLDSLDPEDCESSTGLTITEDPCQKLIGEECVNVPQSRGLTTVFTTACCESLSLCSGVPVVSQQRFILYESELFDCDSVPASIELLPVFPFDGLTVELDLSCVEICEVSNVSHTFPASLTLTVA